MVGSGESAGVQDQTARLSRLTHDLGLAAEDAVRFIGRVDDEQLLDYYAAADVFALPSSSEAQGIVALEAMACGLPVVARAVGGLLGTIDDGRSGFLVPPGDVPALADRLQALLVDEGQRSAIGTAARACRRARVFLDAGGRGHRRGVSGSPRVPASVIAIPLGEASRAEVEAAIERQFGASTLAWLDRDRLRRRPLATLADLLRHRYAAAVLVAPDLRQPRLRLTSLVLGLTRADTHWRIDLQGNREAWRLKAHLARNLLPIVRHLIACGLALALGEPVLRAIDLFMKPRTLGLKRPTHLLYLRSQLWLGLEGGGSVAHTAGVVARPRASRRPGTGGVLRSIARRHRADRVVAPETWFDGWLRDVEDLAYNVAFLGAALKSARRRPPQAIYQRHTTFNCSGAVLSRVLRLPLVLEFNSSEVWKGRYWGGLHLARAAAIVERINLRAADRVVVVSRVLRDYVRSTGCQPKRFW